MSLLKDEIARISPRRAREQGCARYPSGLALELYVGAALFVYALYLGVFVHWPRTVKSEVDIFALMQLAST